ncbi:MAG: hypothetical protein J6A15_03600 [Clostridia bacterium]|nr:hypothetical protein [Clostridia bacterium]
MDDDDDVKCPSISDNHTNEEVEDSNIKPKRMSIISIAIIVIFLASVFFVFNSIVSRSNFNIENQVFKLSDNSTLIFQKDNQYILSYQMGNQYIKMSGKYRITFGDEINENVKSEYKYYINDFKRDEYVLGFLELQNDELYINDIKNDDGYINTYYILMVYYEEDKMTFLGYNVDTGTKIKFTQQIGGYEKYIESNTKK